MLNVLDKLAIDDAISDWLMSELGTWCDHHANEDREREERLRKRVAELDHLKSASYEDKLLGRMNEESWRSLDDRWTTEQHGSNTLRKKPANKRGS